MPRTLTSAANSHVKETLKLAKRRTRDERRQTVVEGARECSRALVAGIVPDEAYVCWQVVTEPEAIQALQWLRELDAECKLTLFEVTPEIFARLAYRSDSGGLLLVIPYVDRELDELLPPELDHAPFLVVVEDAEKPGNLGAILRTADAAGVDGVIVCASDARSSGTDVHNPNVVRASLGTLFHVPVAQTTSAQALAWLREQEVQLVAATPHAQQLYTKTDLRGPVAVVMGSEADGLGPLWLGNSDVTTVVIPMRGIADSLNLSTSTALLLYEVLRQRSNSSTNPRQL